MKAIKQYFNIDKLDVTKETRRVISNFIIDCISDLNNNSKFRILDDGSSFVNVYKQKEFNDFLMVITTGLDTGEIQMFYYAVSFNLKNNIDFSNSVSMVGILINELMKENNIDYKRPLKEYKNVFRA